MILSSPFPWRSPMEKLELEVVVTEELVPT
jgi:hypothetical protein